MHVLLANLDASNYFSIKGELASYNISVSSFVSIYLFFLCHKSEPFHIIEYKILV